MVGPSPDFDFSQCTLHQNRDVLWVTVTIGEELSVFVAPDTRKGSRQVFSDLLANHYMVQDSSSA